tara:strand:- start:77 stop:274 length:198 start_codon:yes stop_codon:yes gene_type:complete
MECINFNNKLIFIKKNLNENTNHFIERCWFVIKNLDKTPDMPYDEIINLSNVYINQSKNGCVYNI